MSNKILGGHPDEVDLTPEEKRAISRLKSLAKVWPKSLWLFSASGTLLIMRYGENGIEVMTDSGVFDHEYALSECIDIPNDGGDF